MKRFLFVYFCNFICIFFFFRLTYLCEDYEKKTREYRRLTIKERKLQQMLSRETKEVKIDLAAP